jgi:hypothetical protein
MKKYITTEYHKMQFRNLFFPKISSIYADHRSDRELFQFGFSIFLYSYLLYFLLYLGVFFVGYDHFSNLNDVMAKEFATKGHSAFSLFLNRYPWNAIYLFASLMMVVIFLSFLSYLIASILETEKRTIRAHMGICLHSNANLMIFLMFIFMANTFFPTTGNFSIVLFGGLMSIWILGFLLANILSTYIFVKASNSFFHQPKRRAIVTWLLPFWFVVYTIFGIISGS